MRTPARVPLSVRIKGWMHEINYEAFLLKHGLLDWLLCAAWRRWLLLPFVMTLIAAVWLFNLVTVLLLALLWAAVKSTPFDRVQ